MVRLGEGWVDQTQVRVSDRLWQSPLGPVQVQEMRACIGGSTLPAMAMRTGILNCPSFSGVMRMMILTVPFFSTNPMKLKNEREGIQKRK